LASSPLYFRLPQLTIFSGDHTLQCYRFEIGRSELN
jgi:hypothetical protein